MTTNLTDSPERKRFEKEKDEIYESAALKRSAVNLINMHRAETIPQLLSLIQYNRELPYFSFLDLKESFLKVIDELKRQEFLGNIEINSITEMEAESIQTIMKALITDAYVLVNGFCIDVTHPRDAVIIFFVIK